MISEDSLAQKIIMQGVHVELTPSLQSTIRERFAVLLRHNSYIIRINIRLHLDQKMGQTQQAHYTATGHIEIGGPDLVASAEGTEAYDTIDALAEKLNRLLRERQGRRKDKRNHPQDVELATQLPKTGPN